MAFDPCREWLGIDPVDLADPCSVLGLPAGDHPAAVIAEAAATRLKHLGEIAPGPFEKARQTLVKRVEEARDRLLETAVPASEPVASEPVGLPAGRAGPAEPWNPTLPPTAAATPTGPEAKLPPLSGTSSVRPRRRRRGSRSSGLTCAVISIMALLAAAVAVLAVVVVQNPFGQPDSTNARVALRTDRKAPARSPQPKASDAAGKSKPARPPAAVQPRQPKTRPSPAPPDAPADPPGNRPPADDKAAPEPPAASQPPAEDKARREREMQAAAAMTAERRRAIDTLLTEAFTSLQAEEFDAADASIKKAYQTAGDDVEAATRAEAWRALATCARQFIGHRDEAFKAASAGREYEAGGKVFAIIEITPTLVVYKFEGRIVRVPREQLDPALAMAIVDKWFAADGRAANHLFLGARWLCDTPPNPRRARAEWRAGICYSLRIDLLIFHVVWRG